MILAILQARLSSTRLPGKVLKPILGKPMLLRQIERVARASMIDQLIVATSTDVSDDPLESICKVSGIPCFRGALEDVLDRFYQAAKPFNPDHVIRLTGDCPFADPDLINQVIAYHLDGCFDYTSTAVEPTFPDGLDVEIFRFACLEHAWREAALASQREHVTPFIYLQPNRFKVGSVKGAVDLSHLRWTVDELLDFKLVTIIYEELYPKNPLFTTKDILSLLEQKGDLKTLNTRYERNEGYRKSLAEDAALPDIKGERMSIRYHKSEQMLERALKSVPLGSQTFSKSKTHYPHGVSPYFISKGKGSRVWDVDGNEYIDFINSLAAVTLGYNDPDVTAAVRTQLDDGVIFSLPHPLEHQVSEKIIEMVPSAEMVRFGKNGSDATAGAVRIARAYTGRDHVAVCGYHGWQDWYIGATARNKGVPTATRELTHVFSYNDLDSLRTLFKQWAGQVACVIMEPMNITEPAPGFLENVRDLTHRHGAVFVFDETVTGFRFAKGGAQEYFNVIPDLATFGKGLANGYPVSAIAGRAEIMKQMEEVFFSFTFGGETLSLAAALATLNKLQKEPVIETLWSQGHKVITGVKSLIAKHGLDDALEITGKDCWSFLLFRDTKACSQWEIKTLFLQEVFARGILAIGTHNMSYAHTDADIARLLAVYDETFSILGEVQEKKNIRERLKTEPLVPLFKIR